MVFHRKNSDEIQQSLTNLTLTNDDHQSMDSQSNHYSNLEGRYSLKKSFMKEMIDLVVVHPDRNHLSLVNSEKIINESSHATIRSLPLHRRVNQSFILHTLAFISL